MYHIYRIYYNTHVRHSPKWVFSRSIICLGQNGILFWPWQIPDLPKLSLVQIRMPFCLGQNGIFCILLILCLKENGAMSTHVSGVCPPLSKRGVYCLPLSKREVGAVHSIKIWRGFCSPMKGVLSPMLKIIEWGFVRVGFCPGMGFFSGNSSHRHIWRRLYMWLSCFITKTSLYNFDPLKPHFYIVKLEFTGVYIIFLISAQNHRLWVPVRTASPRRF